MSENVSHYSVSRFLLSLTSAHTTSKSPFFIIAPVELRVPKLLPLDNCIHQILLEFVRGKLLANEHKSK